MDLRPFCSTEPDRPFLHKPFSRGEWTYATTGHIMVRVPRLDDVPDNGGKPPDVERFFREPPAFRPWRQTAIPDVSIGEQECPACDGGGYEHDDCPCCTCECEKCRGTGKFSPPEEMSIGIGGTPFAARYVRLLQSLPSVAVPVSVAKQGAMSFRFDGGEGVLMPLSWALATHIEEGAAAQAGEAGTAETALADSVHEHAVGSADAP